MKSALEALERLREGNRRFVAGVQRDDSISSQKRRSELEGGQFPFAIILGCSDSRVPVEIVFDQNLGDLFVIRVAGNIAQSSQIGSIEFAAERFGTQLVVVLGHSRCGAVMASLEDIQKPIKSLSQNLRVILDYIQPSVEQLMHSGISLDPESLLHEAIRANVRACVKHLCHGSEVLEQLIQGGELVIVGAEYALETGIVDFFEGLPQDS